MKIIKISLIIVITALSMIPTVQAQFIKSKKKETKLNWQNLSFGTDNIYGAGINEAYDILKDKKQKKEITVAIVGPGIDTEHEDLQGSIWLNGKEKQNGIDDNKNEYIDDINGWNYLGNTKGDVVEETLGFGDREFFRLKDMYGHIQFDGKEFYTPNEDETKMLKIKAPKDVNEYKYYTTNVRNISGMAAKHGGLEISKMVRTYTKLFDKELRAKFPDKNDFTVNDFVSLGAADNDSLRMVAMVFTNLAFNVVQNPTWNSIVKYLETTQKASALRNWEKALVGVNINDRELIGDNPYNLKDTKYGNNVLLAENAGSGTMYAGIVGAQRNNNIGIDGISNASIMILRTNPNKGDAFMKDIARAIYYAVDNGADIIQLSTSSIRILPYGEQHKWIEDALSYAESKNVLIIQPVEDSSFDLDNEFYFPNRKLSSNKTLQNIITVAASDQDGNPLVNTNFGVKSLDLFAPGKDIYSSYTGDTYRSETGSDMAASVVTGVAALLKSYYPTLGGQQIREILMSSVTDRTEAEVEKQAYVTYEGSARMTKDLFLFEDLCASRGILNAAQAVKLAEEKTK